MTDPLDYNKPSQPEGTASETVPEYRRALTILPPFEAETEAKKFDLFRQKSTEFDICKSIFADLYWFLCNFANNALVRRRPPLNLKLKT